MKQINPSKMKQIEQYGNKQKQLKVTPNPVHEKLFNEIVDNITTDIIENSGVNKTYEENIRHLTETNKDVAKVDISTIFSAINAAIANPKDTELKDKYKELYALYQPNVFIDAILKKVFKVVSDSGYTTLLSEDRSSYYLADAKTLRPVALFRDQKTYDRPVDYKSAHPLAYAIFLTNDKGEWEPIKYNLTDYAFKEGDYDFYPTRKAEDIDLVEYTDMVSLYTDINYAFGIIKYLQKLMEKVDEDGEVVQPNWAIVPVDIDTLKSNYWYNDEIKIFSVAEDDLAYPDDYISPITQHLTGEDLEDVSFTEGNVTAKATKKLSLKTTTKHDIHTNYDVFVVEVTDTEGNDIVKMNPGNFADAFSRVTEHVYKMLPKEKGLVKSEILNPVGGGNVFYIIQPYVKEIVPYIGMTHDIVSGILEPLHHSCLIEYLVEQNSDKIIDLIRMLPLLKPDTKLTDIKENLLYRFYDSLHEEYVGFGGSILTDLYLESVPAAELHNTKPSDIQLDTSLYCVYTINPVTAVKYGIDNSNVIRATKDIPSFDSLYVIAFKTREEAQAFIDATKNPLHYCILEDTISFSNVVEVNNQLYMEYNHNFLDYVFDENGKKSFIKHVF
jgi:hypothetical protein